MKFLGRFYKETTSGRSDLQTRHMPADFKEETKVERDLFGWKLYSGKHFIECRSQEEARYLKVYFDLGMEKVAVPEDDNYLKTILPELEYLKRRADEIIGTYVDGILKRGLKERVKREVYQEILSRT